MKKSLKIVAALAFVSFCFNASAQGTKPMAKDGKMDSKSEEKMETKKMEMKEDKMEAKSGRMNSGKMHASKMHSGKMSKSKM